MGFFKMMYIRWSREDISSWKSMKKAVYMIFPLLVYFLVHDAVQILLWAGLNRFLLACSKETSAFLLANSYTLQGVINGLAILGGVAAVWQAVKNEIYWGEAKRSGQNKDRSQSRNKKAALDEESSMEKKATDYMVLGTFAFLSALGFNVLFQLLEITKSSKAFEDTANAQFGVIFLVGLVLYGILSPLAEEAIFRGLIYNRMKRCFNFPIALAVSSLLFGCYHGNAVQAVYGTILGLLIAYTYEKYESFAAPALFHAIANVSIYALAYYHAFDHMNGWKGWIVAVISLTGAGICFWRIKCRRNPENA